MRVKLVIAVVDQATTTWIKRKRPAFGMAPPCLRVWYEICIVEDVVVVRIEIEKNKHIIKLAFKC